MAPMPLHQAIRLAYEGRIKQTDLAERLKIDQPRISKWVTDNRGERDDRPTFEQLAALEDAAGRPRGFVLTHAGLVHPAKSVTELLAVDPALGEDERALLIRLYESMLAGDPTGTKRRT